MPRYMIEPNEQVVREHAQRCGFRANRISTVRAVIGPITAEM